MSFITSYCNIKNEICFVNGKSFLIKHEEDWTKQLFKSLKIEYPKFYKMDALSKVAFIGSELIRNQYNNFNTYSDDEIALIFSNRSSSGDTDIKFNTSYSQEALPSPALFVYTLPNILIGEIAIRNGWYGENLFFITPEFNSDFFQNYVEIMLSKRSKACLCGWVEVLENNIDAFLFFTEQSDTCNLNLPLTSKILANLYKGIN